MDIYGVFRSDGVTRSHHRSQTGFSVPRPTHRQKLYERRSPTNSNVPWRRI